MLSVFDDTFEDNNDFHLKKLIMFLTNKAKMGTQLFVISGSTGRKKNLV